VIINIIDRIKVELSQETTQRLQKCHNDQDSVDDLITDLLDDTRNSVTLTEFTDLLVDAVDPDQIALYEDFSSLLFVVNTTSTEEKLEGCCRRN